MKEVIYNSTEAFSKALELGSKGYRSVAKLENVVRFDRAGYVDQALRDAVPPVAELMKNPRSVPLLMTENCVLWQPSEFTERLVNQAKAIAELIGLPEDAPLDAVYPKVAEMMKERES